MNVLIWSKYDCSQCEQAKNLLKSKGINFEERKLGDGWTKEDLLESVPTARSVPQIFIDENYVGGFTDLKKYLEGLGNNG
jgi:glutaredoxin